MQTWRLGISVVGFLFIGALSQLYLLTQLGEVAVYQTGGYTISAEFTNASGLEPGSVVELAGVQIGQVSAIQLIGTRARVSLNLRDDVRLQEDAIASIQTKGLLGGRYLLITPGGSEKTLPSGGKIRETESPLDLPGLIAAYIASREKASNTPKDESSPQDSLDLDLDLDLEQKQ